MMGRKIQQYYFSDLPWNLLTHCGNVGGRLQTRRTSWVEGNRSARSINGATQVRNINGEVTIQYFIQNYRSQEYANIDPQTNTRFDLIPEECHNTEKDMMRSCIAHG
jgi:hypothetical protein